MQWEGFTERSSLITPTLMGDVHSIENSSAAEAKVAALMRRIEALELKRTPAQLDYINQIFTPSCYNCHSPTHELKDCPLLPNPLADGQNQLNAMFHHQRNDPYAPTYNPRWRDHPNFCWNHGTYQKCPLSNENS